MNSRTSLGTWRRGVRALALAFVIGGVGIASGQAVSPADLPEKLGPGEVLAVPTYECCSLYIGHEALNAKSEVLFREKGATEWRHGFPLVQAPVYGPPDHIGTPYGIMDRTYRGSIVNLKEGTDYEAQITVTDADGTKTERTASFRTWSSNVPVAKTIDASEISFEKPITLQGTENGWIRIKGDGKTAINGGTATEAAVTLDSARFLVLENLIIKGGRRHGVLINDSSDIRLINCEISGYGEAGKQDFVNSRYPGAYVGADGETIEQDGVYTRRTGRVTIERCFIHDPRGASHAWYYCHPDGPHTMIAEESKGAYVVRYNDLLGSDEHRWDDDITGWENMSARGGFYRDSDVYGNMLTFGNDDGIELDGGQMNYRLFGNKFEGFLMGISTDPAVLGPSYIFRNLVVNLGDENGERLSAIKNTGPRPTQQNTLGTSFFFNNTFYTDARGIRVDRDIARNNIVYVPGHSPIGNWNSYYTAKDGPVGDFDYDLWYTTDETLLKKSLEKRTMQKHGVFKAPLFVDAAHADFRLQPDSPGVDQGEVIPNFADEYTGKAPDMGALEQGAKSSLLPMRPIPVTVDKQEIRFQPSVLGESKEQIQATVSVPAGIAYEKKFEIRKNDVFNWMRIQPAQGVLRSGESVQFTVSLDLTVPVKPHLYKGVFLVRLEDGYSVPVSVYAQVYDHRFRQAAEFEQLAEGRFTVADDAKASGGKYVELPADETKGVDVSFDAPRDGYYFAFLRVKQVARNDAHHALGVSIDGVKYPTGLRTRLTRNWEWDPLPPVSAAPLKAGKHTLRISPRDAVNVDCILISSDPFDAEVEKAPAGWR